MVVAAQRLRLPGRRSCEMAVLSLTNLGHRYSATTLSLPVHAHGILGEAVRQTLRARGGGVEHGVGVGVVRAAALFYPRAQWSPGARRGPRPWATPRGEAAWALPCRRRRWGASARVHSIGPRPLGGGEGPSVPLWGPRQAAGFPPIGSASAGEMWRSLILPI